MDQTHDENRLISHSTTLSALSRREAPRRALRPRADEIGRGAPAPDRAAPGPGARGVHGARAAAGLLAASTPTRATSLLLRLARDGSPPSTCSRGQGGPSGIVGVREPPSFGISTIHLRGGPPRQRGGGRLVGSELGGGEGGARARGPRGGGVLSDSWSTSARGTRSKHSPAIYRRSTTSSSSTGAKVLYPRLLAILEPRLTKGALVVADNADDSPEFLRYVRDPANGYLSIPFADDVVCRCGL